MMSGGSHETVVATYPRGDRDGPHLGSGMVWCGDPAGARARFLLPPPFALLFAPLGFLTGIIFSGILVGIERRRGFDRTSVSRFAGWGAASGLLLSGIFVAGAALRGGSAWGEFLVFGPPLAIASAVCAAGSLAVARRGERRELPGDSGHPADAELTDAEQREVLGRGD